MHTITYMLALMPFLCIWAIAGRHFPNSRLVFIPGRADNIETHFNSIICGGDSAANNEHPKAQDTAVSR